MEPDALDGILPGTTGNADASSAWPIAGDAGVAAGDGTGRYGVTPMAHGVTDTIGGAVSSVWRWINRPFTSSMAPLDVFVRVGVVLVDVVIWNLVLYHIRIAAEAI